VLAKAVGPSYSPSLRSPRRFSTLPVWLGVRVNPNFVETVLPSAITEWAVPLASERGAYWCAFGTAVIVAPYLAITAKHVIEDHWRRQQGPVGPSGGGHGDFSIVAFQVPKAGEPCLWAVRKIWPSAHTDVVFLKLEPWNEGAASGAG